MTTQTAQIPVNGGDHAVHFYDHESDLVSRVGGYLARALVEGAVAIAIATEAHHEAFEAELEARGIDVEQMREDRRLVLLDARATMSRFTSGGQIDAGGFRRVIGGLVHEASRTGRPVRAYGEMVALLWDDGNVLGAIELEELWNALSCEVRFSLLCGYPSEAVSGPEQADAFRQVCHLHNTVVDSHEVCGRFHVDSQAPRDARHLVSGALREWGFDERLLADAELVCTELATNAVLHARSPFSVVARRAGRGVRISVHDGSTAEPVLRDQPRPSSAGRGLQLVAAVSRRWGVEGSPGGKTVWAEL